jgi:predicted RNA-binding protein with PUA-like domain
LPGWRGWPAAPNPAARRDAPRWVQVKVRLVRKTRLLGLAEMRETPSLASMLVLKRGNRLSITPVTADEHAAVLALLGPA